MGQPSKLKEALLDQDYNCHSLSSGNIINAEAKMEVAYD